MATYEGRLELTWTNKSRRLLAQEDGSYEWVDPADYRVAEVRLLDEEGSVGEVGQRRAADNLLIRGDALNALRSLARLPEFGAEYLGKVRVAYLDPPFNTQQSFLHYDDNLEHSVWLTMMRDRLVQVRDLLAADGTAWVHLDDSEVAYCRVMLDEVFGRENFLGTIVWEKTTSGRNDAIFFSTDQDYILVYARDRMTARLNRVPPSEAATKAYRNPDDDPRGPWREVDYKGPKNADERPNLYYPIRNPFSGQEVWPRRERVWAYGPEEHRRHVEENLLWWGKTGAYTFPKLKKFLGTGVDAMVPRTLWTAAETDTTRRAKDEIKRLFPGVEPFATPKPERLMYRILAIASGPGDVVLDPFVGSGTTAAVAHKMGRRWVAMEREVSTVEAYARPRLAKVAAGDDPGGITGLAGWSGGGGFRLLGVAPSMFEADGGLVFLSDSMTDGRLAQATAAQLGFSYYPDPPFAGRKGRSRLAVIDGLVTDGVVRILVGALAERERLVICGTAIDTEARALARELRPGSSVRKIPASLLAEYRTGQQLNLELSAGAAAAQDGQPALGVPANAPSHD